MGQKIQKKIALLLVCVISMTILSGCGREKTEGGEALQTSPGFSEESTDNAGSTVCPDASAPETGAPVIPESSESTEAASVPEDSGASEPENNTVPTEDVTEPPQVPTQAPTQAPEEPSVPPHTVPEETEGEEIETLSPGEMVLRLAQMLKEVPSYKSEISGTVKAPLYSQEIRDTHIKVGKEAYLRAISTSKLVNVGKEAFFSGDQVVMRIAEDATADHWPDSYTVLSLQEYCSSEGNTPLELSNYILTPESIQQASLEKGESGQYTLTVKLDPEAATKRYAVKMMNYGNLKSLPEFSKCSIVISFDENGTVHSLQSFDTYKIKIGPLALECKSEMTETFTYSESITIPNADTFRSQLK